MFEESPVQQEKREGVITSTLLGKTFFWMFLGLLGTAAISWFVYSTNMIDTLIESKTFWVFPIAEIVLVIILSLGMRKLPSTVALGMFFVYSLLNGVSLSLIFIAYDIGTIFQAFLTTSAVFGVLAFVGYKTDVDVTKYRNILFILLIGGIIASLVNVLIGNSTIDIIINWVMLVVFFGILIYDMKNLKDMQASGEYTDDNLAVYFALQLYLDFINIFLRILKAFSKK